MTTFDPSRPADTGFIGFGGGFLALLMALDARHRAAPRHGARRPDLRHAATDFAPLGLPGKDARDRG